MQITVSRQDDGTIELTVTIPWPKVKENYDQLFQKALAEVEVQGFRKGKAPRKLAEKKIDKKKVYQEVVKKIVPEVYLEALKKENLSPIISPKVELLKAQEGDDWQFKASFCEKPKVKLGDYKKAIKELKVAKRTKIWTPGQKEKQSPKETKSQGPGLNELLETVLEKTQIKIPVILIEDQVNQMLVNLLDQIRKLGLSVEQYLKTKRKTVDQLREEYKKSAQKTLALEFILEEIADQEKITVNDKEIDQFINKEKDEKIRNQLQNQRYYLASILRRQKTLDRLVNL